MDSSLARAMKEELAKKTLPLGVGQPTLGQRKETAILYLRHHLPEPLIFDRLLHIIDDENFRRPLLRLQPQTKLLLNRGEERGRGSTRRNRAVG